MRVSWKVCGTLTPHTTPPLCHQCPSVDSLILVHSQCPTLWKLVVHFITGIGTRIGLEFGGGRVDEGGLVIVSSQPRAKSGPLHLILAPESTKTKKWDRYL